MKGREPVRDRETGRETERGEREIYKGRDR